MIALLMIAGTTISFGQQTNKEENHPIERSTGPHNGIIQEAKPYFIEVLRAERVSIYLLDGNAKPLSNKGVTGNAILTFPDNTSVTVDLANDDASRFVSCDVTFKTGNKTVTTKFNFFIK